MAKEKEENKSTAKSFLEACRKAINKVEKTLTEVADGEDFENLPLEEQIKVSQSIIKIIGDSGKAIETLAVVEKKVEQEEEQTSRRRAGAKTAKFEE